MDTALANGQSAVHVTITTARKRQKHLFCLTRTKPTAAILNVNKNTITGGVGAHRYLGILACKFERVVEQVAHGPREPVPVGLKSGVITQGDA